MHGRKTGNMHDFSIFLMRVALQDPAHVSDNRVDSVGLTSRNNMTLIGLTQPSACLPTCPSTRPSTCPPARPPISPITSPPALSLTPRCLLFTRSFRHRNSNMFALLRWLMFRGELILHLSGVISILPRRLSKLARTVANILAVHLPHDFCIVCWIHHTYKAIPLRLVGIFFPDHFRFLERRIFCKCLDKKTQMSAKMLDFLCITQW